MLPGGSYAAYQIFILFLLFKGLLIYWKGGVTVRGGHNEDGRGERERASTLPFADSLPK